MVVEFIPNIKSLMLCNQSYHNLMFYEERPKLLLEDAAILDEESESEEEDDVYSDFDDIDAEIDDNHEFMDENSLRAHQGLRKLNQLQTLWLTFDCQNASSLADTLKMLANHNKVEYLTIQFEAFDSFQNSSETVSVPNFSSLRTLRLVRPTLHIIFCLHNFIESASNLNKCILDLDNKKVIKKAIVQIVELAPNLQIIELRTLFHLSVKNYSEIVQIRRAQQVFDFGEPLVLYVQWPSTKWSWLKKLGSNYDANCVEIRAKNFRKVEDF